MAVFTFGLNRHTACPDFVRQVKNLVATRTLPEVVHHLLETGGPFILPTLQGNWAAMPAVRARYLNLLKTAIPAEELAASLLHELEPLVAPRPNGNGDADSDADGDVAASGASIDCSDSWLPEWLCKLVNYLFGSDEPPREGEEPNERDGPEDPIVDDEEEDQSACPKCYRCPGPADSRNYREAESAEEAEFYEDADCWEVDCENPPEGCGDDLVA